MSLGCFFLTTIAVTHPTQAGEEAIFSCYDITARSNKSILAFYSDPPPEGFDTAVVDATVAQVKDEFGTLLERFTHAGDSGRPP